MRLVVLTEGFHPPWTEGSRNILLGWLAAVSLYRPVNVLVITTPDPKDAEPTLIKGGIHLQLNSSSRIRIEFVTSLHPMRSFLYQIRPSMQLNSWQRFVELYTYIMNAIPTLMKVRAVELLFSRLTVYEIPLMLHNPGPFTIKRLFSSHLLSNLRNIVITLTFAEVNKLYDLLTILTRVIQRYCLDVRLRILASSPYIGVLVRTLLGTYKVHLQTRIKVLVTLPIPMLGSVIRRLGLDKYVMSSVKTDYEILGYIEMLTRRYNYVVLYIGQLNEVRFPSSLLMRLCKALRRFNSAILIVAPPSYQSRTYLSRIRLHSKPSNLHVILYPLDPDTKERILELADLVIFPYRADARSVVDPPLAIVESLVKGKPVITPSSASVRTLLKLAGLTRAVLPRNHDEFVNAVVSVLGKLEKYEGYTNATLRSLTDPSVVGMTLIKALCD
ncbi:MAG: hypothetical protein DRZ82_08350 [Thermoprotei archaeon]|nr:MAG: hypothetical protein DRZ82_08350 [Thermoprotei archaeon]